MTKTSLFNKTVGAFALAGALVATSAGAQAKPILMPHHHHGWAPGLGIGLGVGLLGAALAYDASSVCHVERRFDEFGNLIGRVRVCN